MVYRKKELKPEENCLNIQVVNDAEAHVQDISSMLWII